MIRSVRSCVREIGLGTRERGVVEEAVDQGAADMEKRKRGRLVQHQMMNDVSERAVQRNGKHLYQQIQNDVHEVRRCGFRRRIHQVLQNWLIRNPSQNGIYVIKDGGMVPLSQMSSSSVVTVSSHSRDSGRSSRNRRVSKLQSCFSKSVFETS